MLAWWPSILDALTLCTSGVIHSLLHQGFGGGALQGAPLTGISGAAAQLHALPDAAGRPGRGFGEGLQELLISIELISIER